MPSAGHSLGEILEGDGWQAGGFIDQLVINRAGVVA